MSLTSQDRHLKYPGITGRALLACIFAAACTSPTRPRVAPIAARLLRQSTPLVCDETRIEHLTHENIRLTAWMTKSLTIDPSRRGIDFEPVSLFDGQRRVYDPREHLYVYGPNDIPAHCTLYAKDVDLKPRAVRPRPLLIDGVTTTASYGQRRALLGYQVTMTLDDPRLASLVCNFHQSDGLRKSSTFVTDELTLAAVQRLLAPGGLDFGDDPLACKVPVGDLSDAVYDTVVNKRLNEVVVSEAPLAAYRSYVTLSAMTDKQKSAYDCAVMGVKREIDTDIEMSQAFSDGSKRYLAQYVAAMRGALGDLDKLGCGELAREQVFDGTQALLYELDARDHPTH